MTPSAGEGRLGASSSGRLPSAPASTPISSKVFASKSNRRRSRAVSLPLACCRSMRSGPPRPSLRRRCSSSFSTRSFIFMCSLRSGTRLEQAREFTVQGRGELLAVLCGEAAGAAGRHATVAQFLHEVPHGQALGDVLLAEELAARVDDDDAL